MLIKSLLKYNSAGKEDYINLYTRMFDPEERGFTTNEIFEDIIDTFFQSKD